VRVCADRASSDSKASFYQSNGIAIAPANDPTKPVARISNASDVQALKDSLASNGKLEFPVNAKDLASSPTLYVLVAYGPKFGSPTTCANPTAPLTAKADVEHFPKGCGYVGYVKAHYDAERKTVVAAPASQFLWATNPKIDRTEGGAPPGGKGCDDYDSPLVLDLSRELHGVTLGRPARGTFDIDGDGSPDHTSWVTSEDTPFLALDLNGNGVVDGVDELFGNRTRNPLGTRESENGFAALAAWDENRDGVIDAADAVFRKLSLWFDRNHDAKTDPGELVTLSARGIRSIPVSFVAVDEGLFVGGERQGAVRQRGAAILADGREAPVLDVWFRRR
jgi:hypothetical protein